MSTPYPHPSNDWWGWATRPTPTVRHGDRHASVNYLNSFMRFAVGQDTVPGSTYFAHRTVVAVENFQRFWALTVDGWVGPQTWECIKWLS